MQHKDSEYLGEVEEELQMAVLEAIPAERYARRLRERPNDELQTAVLEAIPAEKRVRGLSPEEVLGGLSEEQVTRLRELLERRGGSYVPAESGFRNSAINGNGGNTFQLGGTLSIDSGIPRQRQRPVGKWRTDDDCADRRHGGPQR